VLQPKPHTHTHTHTHAHGCVVVVAASPKLIFVRAAILHSTTTQAQAHRSKQLNRGRRAKVGTESIDENKDG
jgi:hypothetical protein